MAEAEDLVGVRFDSRLYDFLFIAHSRAVESAKQERTMLEVRQGYRLWGCYVASHQRPEDTHTPQQADKIVPSLSTIE